MAFPMNYPTPQDAAYAGMMNPTVPNDQIAQTQASLPQAVAEPKVNPYPFAAPPVEYAPDPNLYQYAAQPQPQVAYQQPVYTQPQPAVPVHPDMQAAQAAQAPKASNVMEILYKQAEQDKATAPEPIDISSRVMNTYGPILKDSFSSLVSDEDSHIADDLANKVTGLVGIVGQAIYDNFSQQLSTIIDENRQLKEAMMVTMSPNSSVVTGLMREAGLDMENAIKLANYMATQQSQAPAMPAQPNYGGMMQYSGENIMPTSQMLSNAGYRVINPTPQVPYTSPANGFSNPQQPTLSPRQVAAAQKLGVPLNAYAAQNAMLHNRLMQM